MKKTNLILMIIYCYALTVSGQNLTTKTLLNEIKGHWSLDENGQVTYVRIVEAPGLSKDEIYDRVLRHFIYNSTSVRASIQLQDKASGVIINKDAYDDVFSQFARLVPDVVDCWYTVRIDVQEGRSRILLTLLMYDERPVENGRFFVGKTTSVKVEESFPVNPEGRRKNNLGPLFYHSHLNAISSLDAIEEAIKNGTASQFGDREGW